MPGLNGTGPLGYGPMSGRGMGYCRGGYMGRRYFSRREEAELLKEEVGELQKELEAAKERLAELEGQK